MNVFMIGDIVGRAGRRAVRKLLQEIKNEYNIDLVIANGENAAGGFGITKKVADELFGYGIDCLTMGNHTWDNKDIFNFIDDKGLRLIRPLNYTFNSPGKGYLFIKINDLNVAIINLIGQVFMGNYNNPIDIYKKYIEDIKENSDIIIIDFHAEASGEKMAFANFVDGQIAIVAGTHTHVQTADAKILNKGTGYITDLGLTGAVESILGMKTEGIVKRYSSQLPQRYEVAKGMVQLEGAVFELDLKSVKTSNIITIHRTY